MFCQSPMTSVYKSKTFRCTLNQINCSWSFSKRWLVFLLLKFNNSIRKITESNLFFILRKNRTKRSKRIRRSLLLIFSLLKFTINKQYIKTISYSAWWLQYCFDQKRLNKITFKISFLHLWGYLERWATPK